MSGPASLTGLALAHTFATTIPSVERFAEQQAMIAHSITVRSLVAKEQPTKTAPVTKLAQAAELYKANGEMTRSDLISLFVAELGLTPAGAATYYSKLRGSAPPVVNT